VRAAAGYCTSLCLEIPFPPAWLSGLSRGRPPRAPLRALPYPILHGMSRPRSAWLRAALAGPLRPAGEVGAAAAGGAAPKGLLNFLSARLSCTRRTSWSTACAFVITASRAVPTGSAIRAVPQRKTPRCANRAPRLGSPPVSQSQNPHRSSRGRRTRRRGSHTVPPCSRGGWRRGSPGQGGVKWRGSTPGGRRGRAAGETARARGRGASRTGWHAPTRAACKGAARR
jgi:hypothetical protein